MKKLTLLSPLRALALIAVIFGLVVSTSCGGDDDDDDDDVATETTAQIIASDTSLTEFASFVAQDAQLQGYLEGDAEYTVFAPNSTAFATLKATLQVDDLNNVRDEVINQVLRFHFSSGTTLEAELGTSLPTVQGESIVFNADGTIHSGGSNQNVAIVDPDNIATNGVVHKVDRVLIPPTAIFSQIVFHLDKVSQPIFLGKSFSILADAILKADTFAASASITPLLSILTSLDSTVTVFAPVNGVFDQAGITLDTYTGQQWYGIIGNHIMVDLVAANEIEAQDTYTSVTGNTITVLTIDAAPNPTAGIGTGIVLDSDGVLTTPEGQVALGDAFVASNGYVHAFAGVLAPPQ